MNKPTEAELKASNATTTSIQMKAMNGDGVTSAQLVDFATGRASMTYAAILNNYESVDAEDVTESQKVMLAIAAYFAKSEAAQLEQVAKKAAAVRKMNSKRIVGLS